MRNKEISIFRRIDWITVCIYLALVLIGWFNIFAAVYNEEASMITDMTEKYGKQMIWIITAFALATVILLIDSKMYFTFSYFFYAFVIGLLLVVYALAPEVNGARAWLEIGSFRLQAGEFAKLATSLAVAHYMSRYGVKITQFKNWIMVAIIMLIPMAIIILQNDTGTALVFSAFMLMFYREGMPGWILGVAVYMVLLFSFSVIFAFSSVAVAIAILSIIVFILFAKYQKLPTKYSILVALAFALPWAIIRFFNLQLPAYAAYLAAMALLFIPAMVYIYKKRSTILFYLYFIALGSFAFSYSVEYVFHNVLGEHQRSRLYVFFGMKSDPLGLEFNVNQSKIAIGSGDFFGKGFLNGTQTKNNFVPEQSTDFIFCTIGEEWGFVGATVVIALFIALFLRILFLAERQRSRFSRIYGYLVVSILFFHFMVNVGMTIGIMPVIGIPLPFFSYGGSSLWSFTMLVFIFLKLDADRDLLIQ
ncbi:MAG: rod shape-determining protein RodA [Bacteroidales bacterium]|jgi:rod shape determining protein RodA|nr:rod shape-determining protein RodA [Bacteroidales bacterium]